MGGLVVNQPVGRGFKHQLRVLLPMTIAPGRLAVSFPTLLQQLDFGFWCDAEPPKSENVARTETLSAPWTIGPPQQGHDIDVVAGVMLREWRMC
jgi:hypothetical protein